MKEPKFKKGDWCFCEFTLQQVKETTEDRITEVTDGICSLSSYDLSDRCFPLTLPIKRASDCATYWSAEFHKLNAGLNYPDLNRALISRWVDVCENIDDQVNCPAFYKKLDEFGKSVVQKANELKYTEVEGVNIFK